MDKGKNNFRENNRNGDTGGDSPYKRKSAGGSKRAGSGSAERPARKRTVLKDENDEPLKKSVTRSQKNSLGGPRREEKSEGSFDKKPYKKSDRTESGERGGAKGEWKKPYAKSEGDRPYKKSDRAESGERGGAKGEWKKPYAKSEGDRPDKKSDRAESGERGGAKSEWKKPYAKSEGDRPYKKSDRAESGERGGAKSEWKKPYAKSEGDRPYKKSDRAESGERGGAKGEWKKPYAKSEGDKPYGKSDRAGSGDRPYKNRTEGGSDKPQGEWKRPFPKAEERKPEERSIDDWKKPFTKIDTKKPGKKKPAGAGKHDDDAKQSSRAGKRPFQKKEFDKPFKKEEDKTDDSPSPFARKPRAPKEVDNRPEKVKIREKEIESGLQSFHKPGKVSVSRSPEDAELMPLNKYVAHSGVCSRRDAAALVKEGKVTVNGEVILDPGHKVRTTDEVIFSDKKLVLQRDNVYILLNKPKDYITTNDDPQGRKTVMELLMGQEADRLFPVGRLDRNTTGLLLITNDGDLTQRLAHPSFNIKKIYQVTLDKPLTKADFEKIMEGLELEDGKVIVDAMAYLDTKKELGLEIHTGKNRIVRRIFESLGYEVEKLDRVMYAGLTKKNLPRGKWRYLNEREIVLLKHFKS